MIKRLNHHIEKLDLMRKYPSNLSYKGDLSLLEKRAVAIVGTRKPFVSTIEHTSKLAQKLSSAGICVVSGGALGVDAVAHKGAGANNTIMVSPTGLNITYPATNKTLINSIGEQGLILSQFDDDFIATPWSFVARNELVVALSEILIVTQADLNSGSLRSVEFALKMSKDVYVLSHRINESLGTNNLLKNNLAKAIYDIDEFVQEFAPQTAQKQTQSSDEFLEYCKSSPFYDEAFAKFGAKLFEYELYGKIQVINGRVLLV